MKYLAIVVLAVTAVTAENFCTPESTFKKSCNTCICSKDGRTAACTEMVCPGGMKNKIDITPTERYCEPGKQFKMDECSTCMCSADGTKAKCTLGLCPGQRNIFAKSSERKYCTPGTAFSPDNCNVCKCNEDGTSALCTLIECRNKKIKLLSEPKKVCEPYSVFTDYCNTCVCANDGSSFACTKMWCDKDIWNKDGSLKVVSKPKELTKLAPREVCQPHSSFKDYCNTCFCDEDGLSFSCTRMLCDKEIWNKDGSLKVAVKTEENVEIVASKQVCQPRSSFKDYCNTCFCDDDGLSFACTRMLCDKEIWKKDGSLKVAVKTEENVKIVASKQVCQPRSSFKDYCNTCFCDEDGLSFSCTRMLCDKEIWNKDGSLKVAVKTEENVEIVASKKVCQPRSSFKEYCNTCFCDEDGLSFACTRMLCDKDLWNKDGSLKVVTDVKSVGNRICSPNSQFKEYCNTCVCSNDGLSKTCTMMACDKNLWNEDGSRNVGFRVLKSDAVSERVCAPGRAYSPDECNTCVCNEDGTNFACTLKLCLSTFKQAYEVEKTEKWGPKYNQGEVCVSGKAFYSECNRCVCTNTGRNAFCTLMDCRAKA